MSVNPSSKKVFVATLSVVSNTILVILKVIAGLAIGSVSVLSEAIHSGVDLVAAAIALFAVKTSDKPADDGHPFGHGKVENISGTIEALLIFVAAGWIIYESIHKLLHPEPLDALGWGIIVMLVSSLVNIFVSQKLFKVGKETDSVALLADAWHLRTDVYTSAGVMLGLLVITIVAKVAPSVNVVWIDPVVAIIVALMILKAAYDLTKQSTRDLLDAKLPDDELEWIRCTISQHTPVVRGYHKLRTRKSGSHRFIEFHLFLPSELTLQASHDLADGISQRIEAHFDRSTVTVHLDPCDVSCPPHCQDGCLLSQDERDEIRG